jgi:hypothetical protein
MCDLPYGTLRYTIHHGADTNKVLFIKLLAGSNSRITFYMAQGLMTRSAAMRAWTCCPTLTASDCRAYQSP